MQSSKLQLKIKNLAATIISIQTLSLLPIDFKYLKHSRSKIPSILNSQLKNLFQVSSSKSQVLSLNSQFSILKSSSGQALITLLFFSLIGILITTAAVMIAITNRISIQKVEHGMTAYSIAESGMENALLQLLRNPFYTGETLSVGSGSATIQVSGNSPKTILSTGTIGNYKRTIRVQVSYTNTVMSILSWEEQ